MISYQPIAATLSSLLSRLSASLNTSNLGLDGNNGSRLKLG